MVGSRVNQTDEIKALVTKHDQAIFVGNPVFDGALVLDTDAPKKCSIRKVVAAFIGGGLLFLGGLVVGKASNKSPQLESLPVHDTDIAPYVDQNLSNPVNAPGVRLVDDSSQGSSSILPSEESFVSASNLSNSSVQVCGEGRFVPCSNFDTVVEQLGLDIRAGLSTICSSDPESNTPDTIYKSPYLASGIPGLGFCKTTVPVVSTEHLYVCSDSLPEAIFMPPFYNRICDPQDHKLEVLAESDPLPCPQAFTQEGCDNLSIPRFLDRVKICSSSAESIERNTLHDFYNQNLYTVNPNGGVCSTYEARHYINIHAMNSHFCSKVTWHRNDNPSQIIRNFLREACPQGYQLQG